MAIIESQLSDFIDDCDSNEEVAFNSNQYEEAKTYIISRFNNNSNIKLKLAQFIVNTSSSSLTNPSSTDELFNNILYRVTELINLILTKSSLNISYLKLLVDFLSIDIIKFDDIIQLPTNLNDFYIYLSYSIMQLYLLEKNNDQINYRNSRLDTSSILSFSKSWKFMANNNHINTQNRSNLSNLSTSKKRCFLYFQKLILLCCYCKNTF